MNYARIHLTFIGVYLLLPVVILVLGKIDMLGTEYLPPQIKATLIAFLIGTAAVYGICILWLSKVAAPKIDAAFEKLKSLNLGVITGIFWSSITVLGLYLMYLMAVISPDMGRDERFALIEGAAIGPVLMIALKLGVFTSIITLVRGKRIYSFIFVAVVAAITFYTLSRSLLVLVIIPLLPFYKIPYKYAIIGFVFIFFSRFIFTDNLDFSWEWWLVFGFGEMLGVLFGPYALLLHGKTATFYESLAMSINTVPGLSFLTLIDGKERVPELAIYVNEFTKAKYGIYGVASTPYVDVILSPLTFVVALVLLLSAYLALRLVQLNRIGTYIICSMYMAFGFSATSFYRWSFSGATYTFLRDTLLFFFFFYVIELVVKSWQIKPGTPASASQNINAH